MITLLITNVVVVPALVVPIRIARHPSAITFRKLKKYRFILDLETTQHTWSHTVRLQVERKRERERERERWCCGGLGFCF